MDTKRELGTFARHEKKAVSQHKCYIKKRHVFAVMMFSSVFNMFTTRASLSVAIVAMVNTTANVTAQENTNESALCPRKIAVNTAKPPTNGIFLWDSTSQGLLLGSYYYGYMLTNLPGAWMSRRFGIRRVLLVANLLTTVTTLLTPFVAYQSFGFLVALRVFLGLVQGPIYTSTVGSWGVWAPIQEQSFLIATTFAGSSFGTCLSMVLSGLIAGGFGWENVFYVTGGLSGVITVLWFFLVYDSPEVHPRISDDERQYISKNNGIHTQAVKNNVEKSDYKSKQMRIPWVSIMTSPPVCAMFISHFCLNFGAYILLAMLPTYMNVILRFDVASSGGLSALPYVTEWVFSIGVGCLTDMVRRKRWTSQTVLRKFNTIVGEIFPALFIVLAGYIGCNSIAAVLFFTLAVGFQAVTACGCRANAVDIAPAYSEIVFGMSNTFANIPGFLAPLAAGFLLEKDSSINGWRRLFWISGGIYAFGALVFVIFGSGKAQDWATREETTQTQAEDKML